MPYPVEGFGEVYKVVMQLCVVSDVFLTDDSQVEDLLGGASPCPKTCLFFYQYAFCLRF